MPGVRPAGDASHRAVPRFARNRPRSFAAALRAAPLHRKENECLLITKQLKQKNTVSPPGEYEGEYAIYNATPYAEQKKKGFGFANPLNHFYSFYAGEELVGFINLYEEETEVFFGIGVAPAHCGKGYGRQMTEIACMLSRRLFPGKPLYLEVRTWNTRAVRCYQKAGFRIVGEPLRQTTSLGEGLFYRMVAQ